VPVNGGNAPIPVVRTPVRQRVRTIHSSHLLYAKGATCWQPYVKGFTQMANSLFTGWRMEDVWLDR
jgi:hypothetical protein